MELEGNPCAPEGPPGRGWPRSSGLARATCETCTAKGGADSAAVADVLLQRYNSYEGPRPLGNMWSVTRGAMTLRCRTGDSRPDEPGW